MVQRRFGGLALSVTALVAAMVFVPGARADEPSQGIGAQLGDLFRGVVSDTAGAGDGDSAERAVPENREQIKLSFAPLVKTTAPGVVNVYATRMVRQRSPFDDDPFFRRFFGNRSSGRARSQSSLGSGVIVEKSGLVVTNYHVIKNADAIKVALDDGREYQCRVILKDERVDLAVLKIDADETFPSVTIGNSDSLEVGDLVLAIGNPFGVGQTVTSGIVSALARNTRGVKDFGFFIQTDAAINPGNSGGALIDMDGDLVGINSSIYSRSGGSNGIGFAIPANLVATFVDAAESGSDHFETPYIGATFEPVTSDIAEALDLQRTRGALVSSVAEDGPAQKAGLKAGDVITALNGRPVDHPDALGYRLATAGIGNTAKLTVTARNKTRTVSLKLQRAPETVPADEHAITGNNPFAGASVANLSPRIAQTLDMNPQETGAVVVAVKPGSPAARFGLRPHDIIVDVNGTPVETVDDLDGVVASNPRGWRFDIDRDGRVMRQFVR